MACAQLLLQLQWQKKWLKAADKKRMRSEGGVCKGVAVMRSLLQQHVQSDVFVVLRRSLPLLIPGFAPKTFGLHDLSGNLHQQASLLECMKPEILQD